MPVENIDELSAVGQDYTVFLPNLKELSWGSKERT